jgi:hypothetical protein
LRYKSGPIADALGLLAAPSKDSRITNGASTIIVYKTNAGLQSSLSLANTAAAPTSIMSLLSKNWGSDENQINVLVSSGTLVDRNARIAGTVAGPFNLSAGPQTLVLKVNGTSYTYTSTLSGPAETAAAVAANMNLGGSWAPSKPVISTVVSNKITVTLDPTVVTGGELDYGSMEVNPVSTLDLTLGIVGEDRGVKGSRFFDFTKSGSGISESTGELGVQPLLRIRYVGAGTGCQLSIKDVAGDKKLTTTCTGAPTDDLDILLAALVDGGLKTKHSITTLAQYIDAQSGYEAEVLDRGADNAQDLDYYDSVEIVNVGIDLKRDVQEYVNHLNDLSELVSATRIVNIYRAVATFANPLLMSGAIDGVSTNALYGAGLDALETVRANFVIPLISKDLGAVSVDAVNALAAAHASAMWATDGRSERHVFCSLSGTKAAVKAAAKALQQFNVSLCAQEPKVFAVSENDLVFKDPWALACLAAGMAAGSDVGEPNTAKFLSATDLRVPAGAGWDPLTDYQEMIDAGVYFAEPVDTGGFRWVVDNTTYGRDANFVYNRRSVVEAVGFVAYDLRSNLDAEFTGTKAKTGAAETIANFIRARMEVYLKADVIVGDDDNKQNGFKELKVVLEGNQAKIDVSVTPVQGIDFILPTIYVQDIRQSAVA